MSIPLPPSFCPVSFSHPIPVPVLLERRTGERDLIPIPNPFREGNGRGYPLSISTAFRPVPRTKNARAGAGLGGEGSK
jgi:hypothetical protein